MAGNAKPNIEGLKQEINYKYISGRGSQGANPLGLFNGVLVNEWNTNNVMYWYSNSEYVEIEFFEGCHIWRSGTSSWASHRAKLLIKRWDNSTNAYVNVTNEFEQTVSALTHTQWEKTIENVPPGKYRFETTGGARIDSEWYLEKSKVEKYLIQSSNKAYQVNTDEGVIKDIEKDITIKLIEEEGTNHLKNLDRIFDKKEYILTKSDSILLKRKPLSIKLN